MFSHVGKFTVKDYTCIFRVNSEAQKRENMSKLSQGEKKHSDGLCSSMFCKIQYPMCT